MQVIINNANSISPNLPKIFEIRIGLLRSQKSNKRNGITIKNCIKRILKKDHL